MKFLFIFLFLIQQIYANTALHFSTTEMKAIEKWHDQTAKKRIINFLSKIEELKHLERSPQLNRLNTFINGYRPEHDEITTEQQDYWSTPKEFLIQGFGDCEEYAITKYFVMKALNYDIDSLYLGVVKETFSNSHHMVLLYFRGKSSVPLVLDNLSFRILPLDMRTDLELLYCFNETGKYMLTPEYALIFKNKKEARFTDLLSRITQELK
jgi:predicted transglutaminase-like cysteine proteinase